MRSGFPGTQLDIEFKSGDLVVVKCLLAEDALVEPSSQEQRGD